MLPYSYYMSNVQHLSQHGITHIVNCASPVDTSELNYMAIPVLDKPDFNISQFFERATRFIDSAINPTDVSTSSDQKATPESEASNSGGKVVVHCVFGISLSATIVIAYLLMRRHNPFRSLEEAVRFVKNRRNINPNEGFLKQLIKLERQLSSSNQKRLRRHRRRHRHRHAEGETFSVSSAGDAALTPILLQAADAPRDLYELTSIITSSRKTF